METDMISVPRRLLMEAHELIQAAKWVMEYPNAVEVKKMMVAGGILARLELAMTEVMEAYTKPGFREVRD